jgi:hypothetical protein
MNIVTETTGTAVDDEQKFLQRRRGAVRTAWLLAAVATLIFVLFILSGVLGN